MTAPLTTVTLSLLGDAYRRFERWLGVYAVVGPDDLGSGALISCPAVAGGRGLLSCR